jgi:hypothetical protein
LGGTSGAVINSSTTPTGTCLPSVPTGLGVSLHPEAPPAAVRKAI